MLSHNFVTIFPVHIQLSLVSQCAVWTGQGCCMLSAWPRCKCVQRSDYTQEYPGSRQWRSLRCLVFSLVLYLFLNLHGKFARWLKGETPHYPVWTLSPVDMCRHWPDYDQPYITRWRLTHDYSFKRSSFSVVLTILLVLLTIFRCDKHLYSRLC